MIRSMGLNALYSRYSDRVGAAQGGAHYAIAEQDSVVQLNSVGPWKIKYVNPADDQRKKTP
jgi:hypothetical protein